MSNKLHPHKILWLASYPKSGNTWFRAFLSALMNEGEVEINSMKTDGIFSSREIFDLAADISSRDLYDEEAKLMVGDIFRHSASGHNKLSIVKVHDFFGQDAEGKNIIPEEATHCAIYFIRNPLDIAGSLANHNHSSIEEAVKMLNNKEGYLAMQKNNMNKNPQFRQYLSDWSGHVISWTTKPSFPVYVVRYEDMLASPLETFSKVLDFAGWQYEQEQIIKAIEASSFERLSKQEAEKGFAEKNRKTEKFFRSGKMGNWDKELSIEQINSITSAHKETMIKYKFL